MVVVVCLICQTIASLFSNSGGKRSAGRSSIIGLELSAYERDSKLRKVFQRILTRKDKRLIYCVMRVIWEAISGPMSRKPKMILLSLLSIF